MTMTLPIAKVRAPHARWAGRARPWGREGSGAGAGRWVGLVTMLERGRVWVVTGAIVRAASSEMVKAA